MLVFFTSLRYYILERNKQNIFQGGIYDMHKTALIMAGGRGERFWPKSRKNLPKQFLSLIGNGKTMIQLTVERILPIVDLDDIYIATNRDYNELVLEQLPGIPEKNILCEPIGRNTAPCIGLGAIHISKKYEDAVMMVFSSDHLIKYNSMFINTLKSASDIAEIDQNLVTVGITPDYPETSYGYIKFNPAIVNGYAYKVERFVEKPNADLAKEYLASEEYLWNSGMFVWKVSSILCNFKEYLPDIYNGLLKISEAVGTKKENEVLDRIYYDFSSESIDYGIMEKAKHIYILPGTFGWDDVGSWLAVERIRTSNEFGNVISGNTITINSKDCIIECENKLIAAVGLKNLIIVDTKDATLVCDKQSTADIKKVIENLKICNRDEYI